MRFNLQLFAEGESNDGNAAMSDNSQGLPATLSQPETAATTQIQPPVSEPSIVHSGEYQQVRLYVDPETGKRRLDIGHSGLAEPQEALQTQTGQQQAEPIQEASQESQDEYTAVQLVERCTSGDPVDESRIPAAYLADYQAFKEERQRNESAPSLNSAAPIPQATAASVLDSPKLREAIVAEAQQRALAEAGITPEQYNDLEYMDNAKKSYIDALMTRNVNILRDRVQREEQAYMIAAQETQVAAAEIAPMLHQAQADPNWGKINAMMGIRYKSMPYQDAVKIDMAIRRFNAGQISREDVGTLNQYYNAVRREFYGEAAGVTETPKPAPAPPKPPAVEAGGNGAPAAAPTFDFKTLRSMSHREKANFFRDWSKSRAR